MSLTDSLNEVERHVARQDYLAAVDVLVGLRDDPELHPVIIREVVMPRLAVYRSRARRPFWHGWFAKAARKEGNIG